MTMEGVARAGGINKDTLYEWVDKNPEFSDELMAARSAAEYRLIQATEEEDPKWILERSYQYVKRTEITGPGGGPVEMNVVVSGELARTKKPRKKTKKKGER